MQLEDAEHSGAGVMGCPPVMRASIRVNHPARACVIVLGSLFESVTGTGVYVRFGARRPSAIVPGAYGY